MAKIEPAVTQLLYQVPDGASYIDLAKDLSKVNRRLYRQGMTYVVQDVQFGVSSGMRSSDVQALTFSTMGNSWIVHNAWRKGFKAWQKMQNDFMDGDGARLKGKWADFKIYLDDSQAGGTTLEPYAGDGAVYTAGEWVHSNFVYDDAGTSRSPTIHMIGTSTADSAIGLIQAYGDSRNYPTSEPRHPSALNTGFYAEFHGVGDVDDELGSDIEDDNDLPPYDQDEYPGGATNADVAVPVRFGSVTAQQATSQMAGFIVPCGLIQVYNSEMSLNLTQHITDEDGNVVDAPGPNSVYSASAAATAYVIITVAPGPYRGVLAAPMGQ